MADTKNPNEVAATAAEVKDYRAAAESEWGTYVALQTITFNGAVAYLAGDPVPASNVERHGYLDGGLVAKVASKAATDLIAELHKTTTDAQQTEVASPVTLGVPVK